MVNTCVIVGRIKELKESGAMVVAVNRAIKDKNGVYLTDYIPIELKGTIKSQTLEYCNKGATIGVKGRIEYIEEQDSICVVAEKVTFLSSKNHNEKALKEEE